MYMYLYRYSNVYAGQNWRFNNQDLKQSDRLVAHCGVLAQLS